jgi:hypothetical protein
VRWSIGLVAGSGKDWPAAAVGAGDVQAPAGAYPGGRSCRLSGRAQVMTAI